MQGFRWLMERMESVPYEGGLGAGEGIMDLE
jgi:hypothetical protein